MKSLDEFLADVGDLHELCQVPSRLAPFFGFYLETVELIDVLTPKAIGSCYETARLNPPGNLSDILRKSRSFVQVKGGGYRLSRHGRELVQRSLTSSAKDSKDNEAITTAEAVSVSKVLVVHGRDEALRIEFFSLLRTLGLHPLEFEEMIQFVGRPNPYVWEVIMAAFKYIQACLVLITPDEVAHLREDLRSDVDDAADLWQPRPNVLIEAGVALALQPDRTLVVRVGQVREISDLAGQHYLAFDGSPQSRHKLANRLRLARCEVSTTGQDWLSVGKFKMSKR
jgi:predicted nucleotide-binding protein